MHSAIGAQIQFTDNIFVRNIQNTFDKIKLVDNISFAGGAGIQQKLTTVVHATRQKTQKRRAHTSTKYLKHTQKRK